MSFVSRWVAAGRLTRVARAVSFVGAVGIGAAGCGGSKTPTESPSRKQNVAAGTTAAPAKPQLEVTSAPPGVFIVGRISQPEALVGRLASWCNLPFDLNDALSAMGDGVERALNLEAPLDFALGLAPEGHIEEEQDYVRDPAWGIDGGVEAPPTPPDVNAVFSVGVRDPNAVLGAFRESGKPVRARDSGDFVIEVDRELQCALGPALGPTSHRLICGVTEFDLDALGAYARTGLVLHSMPEKAAYMELRLEPLRARHGADVRQMKAALPEFLREVAIGSERFDRAMARATRATVDEMLGWFDGVDTWTSSAEFTPDRDVLVGESTLSFRKDATYLSGVLRRTAPENAVAPALFWDLPQEVDTASFQAPTTVGDDDRALARGLSELLAGGLEHAGVASGVVDAWLRSFERLLESRGTVVVASGVAQAAQPPKKPTRRAPPSKAKPASWGVFNAYYLVGIEGDNGAYADAWKSFVVTFNDKRLRTELGKRFGDELGTLPSIKTRKIAATKAAPAAEVYSIRFPLPETDTDSEFALDELSLHLAVSVVGGRTWMGIGFSEVAALQQVRKVTSGADYPKLSGRQGLDSLRQRPALQGSFGTIDAYSKLLAGLPLIGAIAGDGEELRRAMPNRGATPAIFALSSSEKGPSMTMRFEVPREVFEDGSAFVMTIATAMTGNLFGMGQEFEDD
jgi:hypothetical protein